MNLLGLITFCTPSVLMREPGKLFLFMLSEKLPEEGKDLTVFLQLFLVVGYWDAIVHNRRGHGRLVDFLRDYHESYRNPRFPFTVISPSSLRIALAARTSAPSSSVGHSHRDCILCIRRGRTH